MSPIPGDQARVSVSVGVVPEQAFRIFTEEIDQWWLRGPKYRASGRHSGTLVLESGCGGRLFERIASGDRSRQVDLGTVRVWEPPSRLVIDWRGVNFAPGEVTEVEVTFARSASGSLVTVTHRGWAKLRPDHPARHGEDVVGFIRMMGLLWGDLMSSLRVHARSSAEP